MDRSAGQQISALPCRQHPAVLDPSNDNTRPATCDARRELDSTWTVYVVAIEDAVVSEESSMLRCCAGFSEAEHFI